MLGCVNAEGVHSQIKFGNPCYRWSRSGHVILSASPFKEPDS